MDAKVYAMIDDMSRDSMLQLIQSVLADDKMDTDYLRSFIRQQYETGEIEASDIIDAWENDDDEDESGLREELADKIQRRQGLPPMTEEQRGRLAEWVNDNIDPDDLPSKA